MLHIQVKNTPIYEVLEAYRPEDLEPTNFTFEQLQQQINKPILIEHNESVDCLSGSIIKETEEMKLQTTKSYENEIQTLIIKKIKDLGKHDKRESALTLLIEPYGYFIHDHEFISWLSSKLDYYLERLKSLTNNNKKVFVPSIHFQISFLMKYTHFGYITVFPAQIEDRIVMPCMLVK